MRIKRASKPIIKFSFELKKKWRCVCPVCSPLALCMFRFSSVSLILLIALSVLLSVALFASISSLPLYIPKLFSVSLSVPYYFVFLCAVLFATVLSLSLDCANSSVSLSIPYYSMSQSAALSAHFILSVSLHAKGIFCLFQHTFLFFLCPNTPSLLISVSFYVQVLLCLSHHAFFRLSHPACRSVCLALIYMHPL